MVEKKALLEASGITSEKLREFSKLGQQTPKSRGLSVDRYEPTTQPKTPAEAAEFINFYKRFRE